MEAPAYRQDLFLVNAATAQDEVVEGSKQFISSMAQKAINFLGDEKLSHAQRKEKFRQLLRANYDMKTIGRFALGTYWRTATPAQQAEYQRLFENMVVEVYSQRFADYKGQALEVQSGRTEGKSDILVNSTIVPKDGGEKIKVDWRVRKKEGQYKVIDVIVEGVSMALTQRSDFASVIQRGGGDLDVLLTHLRSGKKPEEEKPQ
ncbi:MAG: ABC transporter substrate-binding protein [Alphaproteobacteria bacterium]|nr:ABC transporter substrate-binding protein [Alphaproteobacteria bacterium]